MKVRFPLFVFASCAALVATVVLAAPAHAAPAAKPCAAPQNRQFDFWVGRWRVTDAATKKFDGTNEITRELGGCVLQEHWKGTGGSAGTSYNLYDASRKRWHQTWVDNSGGMLQLDGGLKSGSMVLAGTRAARGGKTVLDRITWTPRPDGSVRQWWQASRDGGATWTTQFDGIYRRAA
jgi:hypothetical protein